MPLDLIPLPFALAAILLAWFVAGAAQEVLAIRGLRRRPTWYSRRFIDWRADLVRRRQAGNSPLDIDDDDAF